MKVAVLTRYDSNFGKKFLDKLTLNGHRVDLIGLEKTTFSKRFRLFKGLAKKIGKINALMYNFNFWKKAIINKITFNKVYKNPDFSKYNVPIVSSKDINDSKILFEIERIKPNIIILAQSGIIKENILNYAEKINIPIVNAHPGKIPEFRGTDVIRWSLLEKKQIGVTLHKIDKGVDTGPVYFFSPVSIQKNDTIDKIQKRVIDHSIELLVKVASNEIDLAKTIKNDNNYIHDQRYLMPKKIESKLFSKWPSILEYYLSLNSEHE